MSSNDNMLSTSTSEIKNKGFILLDSLFKQNGWHLIKNEMNWMSYTKLSNETDLFDIKIDKKSIRVSVPIKNSPYQFITAFKDYFQASEYIEARFFDFIGKKIE